MELFELFTGLVEATGVIESVETSAAGRLFHIHAPFEHLSDGESIAVNGACLTVRASGPEWFSVAAVVTTLGRTTIENWHAGKRLNLERAMRLGDRLGGHLVQGHVDGVGRVLGVHRQEDALLVDAEVPADIAPLMVLHGSVTVDGVSLTVNALPSPGIIQLSLIEYTLRHTTLGEIETGSLVHVEADMLGKYVQQLLLPYAAARAGIAH